MRIQPERRGEEEEEIALNLPTIAALCEAQTPQQPNSIDSVTFPWARGLCLNTE
jgi:hypothetical protein